jgi:disulfide bond formation protein DsbB
MSMSGRINPFDLSFRGAFTLAAVVCASLIGFALYKQHVDGLEPCPLCIFQRFAFFGFLFVCIAAAVHAPRSVAGRRVYGIFAVIAAATGAGFAIRHLYLQSQPPDPLASCAPSLAYMWESLPMSNMLNKVFSGSADCTKVDWTLLGLSMPGWTLVWFSLFLLGALWFGLRPAPNR